MKSRNLKLDFNSKEFERLCVWLADLYKANKWKWVNKKNKTKHIPNAEKIAKHIQDAMFDCQEPKNLSVSSGRITITPDDELGGFDISLDLASVDATGKVYL